MSIRPAAWFLALILLACAPAVEAGPHDPPAPGPDQALVFLYRAVSARTIDAFYYRDADFKLDGAPIASIGRDQYTWFLVPAGPHTLTTTWHNLAGKPVGGRIAWAGGGVYRYRLEGKATHEVARVVYRTTLDTVMSPETLGDPAQYDYRAPLAQPAGAKN